MENPIGGRSSKESYYKIRLITPSSIVGGNERRRPIQRMDKEAKHDSYPY